MGGIILSSCIADGCQWFYQGFLQAYDFGIMGTNCHVYAHDMSSTGAGTYGMINLIDAPTPAGYTMKIAFSNSRLNRTGSEVPILAKIEGNHLYADVRFSNFINTSLSTTPVTIGDATKQQVRIDGVSYKAFTFAQFTPGIIGGELLEGLSLRGNNPALEWGHSNPLGFGNCIGYNSGTGEGYVAFNCKPGTTANTFKTLDIPGSIVQGYLGGVLISRIPLASTDNQPPVAGIYLKADGTVNLLSIPTHADNAAARAAGLVTGGVYRTNANPSVLCVTLDP
jgi:hypothetical protein